MRGIRSPRSPPFNGARSPRIKAPKYIFWKENEDQIDEIVLSVVNGIAMEAIDPLLFPRLSTCLQTAKKNLKDQGNQSGVDQINRSLAFIESYHKSQEEKKQNAVHREQTKFNDEDVENACNQLLFGSNVEIKSNRFYNAVVNRLKEVKAKAIKEHDYIMADSAQSALRDLFNFENDLRYLYITDEMEEENYKQTQKARKNYNSVKSKWESDIQQQKLLRNFELQRIESDKAKALRSFDKEQEKNKPPKYNPSNNVIELRRKVHYYKNLHRKDDENETRDKLMKLEELEYNDQLDRYKNEIISKRGAIESKYNEQIFSRTTFYDRNISRMEAEAQREIKHAEKCIEHWENRKSLEDIFDELKMSQSGLPKLSSPRMSARSCRPDVQQLPVASTPRAPTSRSVRNQPKVPYSTPNSPRLVRPNPHNNKSPRTAAERAFNKILYSKAISQRSLRF